MVSRLESGESEGSREEACHVVKAVQASRGLKSAALLRELFNIIERGAESESSWSEMGKVFQDRRRLVESERKRIAEMRQYTTAEQALALAEEIATLIREARA